MFPARFLATTVAFLLVLDGGLALAQTATPPALLRLLARVIDAHPSVAAQRAALQGAEAAQAGARWQYYPTPSVSVEAVGASAGDPGYRGNSSVVNVGLKQLLWTGGRLQAGSERAAAVTAATQAAVGETQQQLALRAVQAWGDWWVASRKLEAYEQGLAQHERLLQQVTQRVEEGLAAPSDGVLARGRLAGLRAEQTALWLQSQVALARLGQLLGGPVSAADLLDAGGPAPAPLPLRLEPEEMITLAQQLAPALARLRAGADALAATVAERRAEMLPEVYARLEHQTGNYSQTQGGGQTRVFVGLSSRFGAGLSSFSAVDEAKSRQAAAQAEIEVARRALDEQMLLDLALLAQAQGRRAALGEAIVGAREVLSSWERQYLASRKTWQDLMNAARELVQNEVQLADAQGAELVAGWRLALMTQGLPALLAQ